MALETLNYLAGPNSLHWLYCRFAANYSLPLLLLPLQPGDSPQLPHSLLLLPPLLLLLHCSAATLLDSLHC
jgi:hypothetical protein